MVPLRVLGDQIGALIGSLVDPPETLCGHCEGTAWVRLVPHQVRYHPFNSFQGTIYDLG